MKIVILSQMSAVGTDAWDFVEVPDDMPPSEIDDIAQEYAEENAAMYGYYSHPNEDLGEDEEDESYDDNIGGCWYVYDPKLHDGYTMNGTPDWREP